jgi:hypothetical protein
MLRDVVEVTETAREAGMGAKADVIPTVAISMKIVTMVLMKDFILKVLFNEL